MQETDKDTEQKTDGRSSLSFTPVGEPIHIDEVADAFRKMARDYKKDLSPDAMERVGVKSGSHLLKLISPRVDGEQSVMRLSDGLRNQALALVPSVNAADIPAAKIAFRPIEVFGHQTRSLVDHLRNPDDISARVIAGFVQVFGQASLDVLNSSLKAPPAPISALPAAEFPIIFLPNPAGGDLQATPVSPAAAYMGMRSVTAPFFAKQDKDGPKIPRGQWSRQFVSAKPQNISGAIAKQRIRFHARFPGTLLSYDAELRRFVAGGGCPRLRSASIVDAVLKYADLLDRYAAYKNSAMLAGLDRWADQLIGEAREFIDEIRMEAIRIDPEADRLAVPSLGVILLRRKWPKDFYDRARQALAGEHFLLRVQAAEAQP